MTQDSEFQDVEGSEIEYATKLFSEISQLVSWCKLGRVDRGTTLDKIDEIANRWFSR